MELLNIDNTSTALGSKAAAESARDSGAVAVIGPIYSSHAMVMAPILQAAGTMLAPAASAPEVTMVGDFIFRACFTDEFQARILADFARSSLNATRAAILNIAEDIYSEGLGNLFQRRFVQIGGKIVARESYLLESTDCTKQLRRIADTLRKCFLCPASDAIP